MTTKTITLATIDGPQTVNATVIDGLAYHHASIARDVFSKDEWIVTHVASGRSIISDLMPFHSEQACRVFIEEIQPLADWSLSAEELWKQHGKLHAPSSTAIKTALRQAYQKALAEAQGVQNGD